MQGRQQGFTLLELMIVVAVVGVLAGLALYTYAGRTDEARGDTEVRSIFAELKLRQEQYHVEKGRYHSTGGESDFHPPAPSGPNEPNDLKPLPDSWKELRVQTDKRHAYCAYVAVAGAANDDSAVGSIASGTFGFEAPARDWYYLLAECDLDGDSNTNARYFTASDRDSIQIQNEGR